MDTKMSISSSIKDRTVEYAGRNLLSGFLFGLGLVAFIDEMVFHQLLHWHHFYDLSTSDAGLVSDGIFHAFSWLATVGSLFMVADLRRRGAWWIKRWIGGLLAGGGLFNLYDGLVQHKVMGLHQIRYGVDLLVYDLTWNIGAVVLLIAGLIIIFQTNKTIRQKGTS
ncbi:putative membrane protein [Sinobaca qinghaiensis]|uniref:Putative membrane protein n=2 Tax=Sinobaca qinghaiensis TaxID=342944 RepID=A0A419V506_9BACL|nr:putative membrane protein [Sinobaca qinghaiensis]